ncbi:efflux RND transporter periplasmic adaptor subunit [Teredinibacter turnerae]|uniref:efflux RND transporter periplasmic adaptor subunit n=1 Tax=Teredinibacter turnerae TaxID=2426 RepID=UPI00041FB56F|nr:efflux RND transporter periplasmic adaptor subunit [Teredinibacter turnerae]
MFTITNNVLKRLPLSALLCSMVMVSAFSYAGGGHPHGEERGAESHGDHVGHSDEPALVYTHYTDTTELFVEFPPLVVGEPSTFVAHFTRMDNFKPLTSGVLDIHLKQNNKTAARFRVKSPARTGIFLPDVTAKKAGKYQLLLEVRDGDLHAIHDLGEVTVFPDSASVTIDQDEAEGEINYLKEQQWVNPFAIVQTQARPLRRSVPGFGTVTAPADGFAIVRAPSDGYFSTERFLNAGERVTPSQALGTLIPRLGDGADIGNLLVNLEKARAQRQLAEADVKRLQGLFDQGAIPEKRLLEAKQNLEVARVEFQTNESRLTQRSGKVTQAGIALTAPVAGELVDVSVRPGSFVRAGDALFTIADSERRWLDIQIPEKFGSNIATATGSWLIDEGQPRVLDATTGAQVIKVSRQVNPSTRTLSAAIQYPSNAGPNLLGARFPVHVYVSEPSNTLAVPTGAVIDDGGQAVVYVQSGGETFARRTVVLGIRDGPWVEILKGVEPAEWVVSEGAYYVKLASTGGDAIGHGHAH